MPANLQNHVAIVTGSSTGLGKSIGQTLGQQGARVALNYWNNRERAEKTLAEFQRAGIETVLVRCNVTTEEGVELLYRETETRLGKPDILVVNATCEQPLKPIEQYDWAFYQSMVDFFIKSPFLLTKRGLAHMKSKKWGRIINIASEVYHRSVANFSAYVAAKGGQIGWSRSMSRELRLGALRSTSWRPAGSPWNAMKRTPKRRRTRISRKSPPAVGASPRMLPTRFFTSPARKPPSSRDKHSVSTAA